MKEANMNLGQQAKSSQPARGYSVDWHLPTSRALVLPSKQTHQSNLQTKLHTELEHQNKQSTADNPKEALCLDDIATSLNNMKSSTIEHLVDILPNQTCNRLKRILEQRHVCEQSTIDCKRRRKEIDSGAWPRGLPVSQSTGQHPRSEMTVHYPSVFSGYEVVGFEPRGKDNEKKVKYFTERSKRMKKKLKACDQHHLAKTLKTTCLRDIMNSARSLAEEIEKTLEDGRAGRLVSKVKKNTNWSHHAEHGDGMDSAMKFPVTPKNQKEAMDSLESLIELIEKR